MVKFLIRLSRGHDLEKRVFTYKLRINRLQLSTVSNIVHQDYLQSTED